MVGTGALNLDSLFYVYFRKWCSRANRIAFHDYRKKLQNYRFSRIVYLASTRARLLAALGCSWRLPAAPWVPMATSVGSWWKCMKIIVLFEQHFYFSFRMAILNVSHELYSGSLKVMKTLGQKVIKSSFLGFVLSTSGANAGKSLNRDF